MYNNSKFLLSLGYSIIVFAAIIEIISAIFYFSGIPISQFNFWIALLATVIFLRFMSMYYRESTKQFLTGLGILAGIFLIGGFFSYLIYDLSYDGQAYQQEAIIQITNGWNPYRGIPVEGYIHDLWINHYAKGPWIIAGSVYKLTGLIETAKVFNFAFLFASFFVALGTMSSIFPNKKRIGFVIALLLAFNPVSLVQLNTFYVDGQLYSLLLVLFCLAYLLFKEYGHWELIMLCLTILLLVNIKFTALAYAGIIGVTYLITLFIFKKKDLIKLIFWPVVITFIVSIVVIGYNPYVTNTIDKGNPAYPLMGEGKVDIITSNSPLNFVDANPIKNIGRSLFSKSDNIFGAELSEVKIPLTLDKEELKVFKAPDVRVGGFGPLFGGTVLLAIALFLISSLHDWKKTKYIFLPGGIILISILINSEAWWARYAPQLWILPILVIIYSYILQRKLTMVLSWILIAILFINTSLVSYYHFMDQYNVSRKIDAQLDELETFNEVIQVKQTEHLSNRMRFLDRGIEINLVNELSCEGKDRHAMQRSQTEYCK